ncbi:MAG: TatD family hydrolase [Enterobacteriaceae bacterium]
MPATSAPEYSFFDTHCHLDFPPFSDDPQASWQRAEAASVKAALVPAVTADRFTGLLALVERNPALYAAMGLHPLYIAQHGEEQLAQLQHHLAQRHNSVVAVGEIGLDNYPEEPQLEQQRWLLRQQLALAKQHDLPVVLHCRKAHDLLAQELRQAKLPRTGVVHGFSGSLSQASAYIRLGYRIGVGGVITWPRANKTRKVIAALPLISLLLETDAPDMPLYGMQGQPNRPENIAKVFAELCVLRSQEPPQEIAQTLWDNSVGLFTIPLPWRGGA